MNEIFLNEGESTEEKTYKRPIFEVSRPSSTYISLNQALEYVGDNSTYSKRALYLITFYWIWYGCLFLGLPILMGNTDDFNCPSKHGLPFICDEVQACKKFEPDQLISTKPWTIAGTFKLFCTRRNWIPRLNSGMFGALVFSGFFYPTLANKYGRRPIILIATFVSSISLFMAGFTVSFSSLSVLMIFASIGFSGLETVGRTWISEISGVNFKVNSMAIINMVWAFSQIFLVFLEKFIDWRSLFKIFFGFLFLLGFGIGYIFIDESPKFLLLQQQIDVTLKEM